MPTDHPTRMYRHMNSTHRRVLVGLSTAAVVALWACNGPTVEPPLPDDLASIDVGAAAAMRTAAATVRNDPENPDTWDHLGMVYLAHDRPRLASECLEHAVALHEPRPVTHYCLAHAADSLGNADDRRRAIDRAMALRPDAPHLHWQAAQWAMDNGDLERAGAMADAVAALPETGHSGPKIIALVRLAQDRPTDAHAAIVVLTTARPNDRYARYLLGRSLQAMGQADQAAVHLRVAGNASADLADPWLSHVASLRADLNAHVHTIEALVRTGKPDQAGRLMRTLISQYGPRRELRLARASISARSGRHAEAIRELDELITESPQWAPPYVRKAHTLLQAERANPGSSVPHLDRAVAAAESATTHAPGSTDAWYALGRARVAAEQDDAADAFARCVELAPHNGRFHAAQAEALAAGGNTEAALETLDRMDGLFGLSVDSMIVRARVLAAADRHDEALDILTRCSTMAPGHPGIARTLDLLKQRAP